MPGKRKSYQVDPAEILYRQRRYAEFIEKFNIGEFGDYRYVDLYEFFQIVFERQGQLRLQEKGKMHYFDGHYNAIIRKISTEGRTKKWWIVTDTLDGISQYRNVKFAIVSPVTYIGYQRSLYKREMDENGKVIEVDHTAIGNARYLFAFAIDLDSVGVKNMKFIRHEIDAGRYPEPTMIVTSGTGIHIYYCLERPVAITRNNIDVLNRFKLALTMMLWRYNGTTQQKTIEAHNIGQGYRFPETKTKFDRVVHGYTLADVPTKYYTLRELHNFIKTWYKIRPELFAKTRVLADETVKYLEEGREKLTVKELQVVENDMRLPAHWSLATARKKFGEEWYQQIKDKGSVDWKYSKNFYNAWLEKLQYGAEVTIGHRYWCLYILASWAWNCQISFSRLEKDARSLLENFNALVNDEDKHVPFTLKDCNDALAIYKERAKNGKEHKAIRLSRAKTERITDISITPNTRNFRSMSEHGRYRLDQRKKKAEENGENWAEKQGRPSKDIIIAEWCETHPGGTQYACAKELGLDKKTVRKWWPTKQKKYSIEMLEQSILHDSGHNENIPQTTYKVHGYGKYIIPDEVAKEILLSMSIPDKMIPLILPDMKEKMLSREFWDAFRVTLPDESMWPGVAKDCYKDILSHEQTRKEKNK